MFELLILSGIASITSGYSSVDSSSNDVNTYDFPFVTRSQWQAMMPKENNLLRTPVPYVVIHHTYIPEACYTRKQCSVAMRTMQNFHMKNRNWSDIGYNFCVGGDGAVYEGRGWTTLGAHSLHFNPVSLGICFIGDFQTTLPSTEQIKIAKSLIATGVELGYIKPDYKLVGHRQVRDTVCPGDALYDLIKTWNNYSPFPGSVDDLPNVIELKLF